MTRWGLLWRNVALILRRAGRDKRAFRFVLVWLGFAAWIAYEAGVMVYLGFWGTISVLCLLLLGFGIAILIGTSNARAGDTLLKLSAHPVPQDDEYRGHRPKLVKALLRLAVLADRAGCEALHAQGKIAPEIAGACRRRTLDLARSPGLWEEFTDEERDLLMAQEGSWAWEQVWPRVVRGEDVRVLRWVVGMDRVLVPFEFLKPDLVPAVEISVKPDLVNGERCMAPYDLRPAETMAQNMFARCLADGAARGWLEVTEPEERRQLLDLADRAGADESGDLLIGSETVGKASLEQVRWIGQAALRRVIVLAGVIRYLNGPVEGVLELERKQEGAPPEGDGEG